MNMIHQHHNNFYCFSTTRVGYFVQVTSSIDPVLDSPTMPVTFMTFAANLRMVAPLRKSRACHLPMNRIIKPDR